jgi:choline dehydrogenase-like flavoprotein
MIEHTPNRDSRITVSREQRDELGLPRVHLDMRYGEPEFDSIAAAIGCLATELGSLDIGRIRWAGKREQLVQCMDSPSRHHMGATRMATSPRQGVVDEHCRVHGIDNLYIAGSSVFPTSGIANPTLTLLALTFRLGDRLTAAMKTPARARVDAVRCSCSSPRLPLAQCRAPQALHCACNGPRKSI